MQQASLPSKAPILWFAILSGLLIMNFIIPAPSVTGGPSPAPLKFLPLVPLFVGTLIRWVILPTTRDRFKAMPLFILGSNRSSPQISFFRSLAAGGISMNMWHAAVTSLTSGRRIRSSMNPAFEAIFYHTNARKPANLRSQGAARNPR